LEADELAVGMIASEVFDAWPFWPDKTESKGPPGGPKI